MIWEPTGRDLARTEPVYAEVAARADERSRFGGNRAPWGHRRAVEQTRRSRAPYGPGGKPARFHGSRAASCHDGAVLLASRGRRDAWLSEAGRAALSSLPRRPRGDRLDNDVAQARMLEIWPVLFRTGHISQQPRSPDEVPDFGSRPCPNYGTLGSNQDPGRRPSWRQNRASSYRRRIRRWSSPARLGP